MKIKLQNRLWTTTKNGSCPLSEKIFDTSIKEDRDLLEAIIKNNTGITVSRITKGGEQDV